MYKTLNTLVKSTWDDKYKRFAMARLAKAVVDECWLYVGAETKKKCVITLFAEKEPQVVTRLVDYTPVDDYFVPVSSVGAELARIIPKVGCDPDAVARAIAIHLWNIYRYEYKQPKLVAPKRTPKPAKRLSLLDYCYD